MQKTVEQECYICGNTKQELILEKGIDYEYGIKGEFNFYECSECGLIQQLPIPSMETIQSFYPETYHSYQRPSNFLFKKLSSINLNRRLERYKKLIGNSGTVLDVGCGDGEILEAMQKKGDYDCYGVEIKEDIAKKGQDKNLKIYYGTLENCEELKENFFDLIIINHLIEHVSDPKVLLEKAYKYLKKGGWLLGETPNTNSRGKKKLKGKWSGYHVPRHIHLFSDENLALLLKKIGFSKIEINKSLNPGHWALSLQNLYLHKKENAKLKNGKAWIYPFCLLAAIPVTLFENIFQKKSDIMYFEIQK